MLKMNVCSKLNVKCRGKKKKKGELSDFRQCWKKKEKEKEEK